MYIVYQDFPEKTPIFKGTYEECCDYLEGCCASYTIEYKKEESFTVTRLM